MLTIVPTPIGNLKDITLRAIETLKRSDGIICEDSRRTGLLLNHYKIQKPLLVLNDFNESRMVPQIISKLIQNEKLSLVSDAGTPLISDPGFKLVRECISQNIPVDSLPGPSSIITSLTLSGLPPDKFLFLGYLPDKQGKRNTAYQTMKKIAGNLSLTFILFVPPFKLPKTLSEMEKHFGDTSITLAHELSKIHQEVKTQSISSWQNQFKSRPPKGEYVLLIHF